MLLSEKAMGTPLQYSCLENPLDGGAWWATVHGVAKTRTKLSDFTFTFHFHALEKEMATHSSVLAWRIPEMGEPGGLLSMGSHRVGHDRSDLAVAWNCFEFSFVANCIACENDNVICFFLVILSFLFFSVFIWLLLLVKEKKNGHFFSFQSQ